jgi:hypothetical protein
MYLVQILLPLTDNAGTPFPQAAFEQVRAELTERFGGLTAFVRSPAAGRWKEGGATVHDDVVVHEVMADRLDRDWWRGYREELRARFRQDSLVVRASPVELL